MKQLQVELGERSYPIYIGHDILNNPALFTQHIHGKQVLIVSNQTIADLYLAPIQRALHAYDVNVHLIPDGEQHKTLGTLETILSKLLELKYDRKCTLIALGGGVIGDITGFAAATYVRGVDFIQVPTTLLAQVDSSVGGKTAVNHPLGKNMIGAFHQPNCVIADTNTLSSLPKREVGAGIAEVIKYGLINDLTFFEWLETNIGKLVAGDQEALAYAIEQSCRDKADIVALDEKEGGARALLNLGHTFGHAIEANLGYGEWLHGEAVAAGMVMAAELSKRLGFINEAEAQRIIALLKSADLPVTPPANLTVAEFMATMMRDKKVQDGTLRLVLNSELGQSGIYDDVDAKTLETLLRDFLEG